jgi:hypothetical protein
MRFSELVTLAEARIAQAFHPIDSRTSDCRLIQQLKGVRGENHLRRVS